MAKLKFLFFLPLLMLCAACAGFDGGGGVSINPTLSVALASEVAVTSRCPRSPLEWAALDGARIIFDQTRGAGLNEDERRQLERQRRLTDETCGRFDSAAAAEARQIAANAMRTGGNPERAFALAMETAAADPPGAAAR